jgi:flavin reductase (DIM6/NTAB) family NADH-FMN oxidoreductase RutF/pimeloyl-ACP methyl ester carboxylesterase
MTRIAEFDGVAGVKLRATLHGKREDPSVLLLHGGGQSGVVWQGLIDRLLEQGRFVVNLDLRGHGESDWPEHGHYSLEAFVDDIRNVLGQLDSRPVIIAATVAGWAAIRALSGDAANLASGLVLVDFPLDPEVGSLEAARQRIRRQHEQSGKPAFDLRWLDWQKDSPPRDLVEAIAPQLKLPVLVARGSESDIASNECTSAFVAMMPDAEQAEIPKARLIVSDNHMDEFAEIILDFLGRRQAMSAEEYRNGSDARLLRNAMGCFATGVTVVTAFGSDGLPKGATVNSFTSVSLDPPMLLVCIAKGTETAEVIHDAERFAVNLLQSSQRSTSNCFATKGIDRFAEEEWQMGEWGAPIFPSSLGAFECKRHTIHEGGDHFILIGAVERAHFWPARDPLLFYRGGYRHLNF